jgi:hypothetical protein
MEPVSVCARPQGTSENFCFRGPAEEKDRGTRAARDHRGYYPDLVVRGLKQFLCQFDQRLRREFQSLDAAVRKGPRDFTPKLGARVLRGVSAGPPEFKF